MKPRAKRSVNASPKAGLLAAGSCLAILSACADGGPLSVGSVPYAGDIEPSTVRPASPSDYPTLSNVPPRPDDLPTVAERRARLEALQADLEEGQALSEANQPAITEDLADIAAERNEAQATVVAEAVAPEPAGAEEPGQAIGRAGEGPIILDADGVADNTQPVDQEQLGEAQTPIVAEALGDIEPDVLSTEADSGPELAAGAAAAEEPARRGFFARLFGRDRPEDAEPTPEGEIIAVIPEGPVPPLEEVDQPTASVVAEIEPVEPATPDVPSDGNLMLPQAEEPAPTVVADNAVPSDGELMLPQTQEPAAPAAVAETSVPSNGDLMIPQDVEPESVTPVRVAQAPVSSDGDLMIPQVEEPGPADAPTVVVAVSDGELMLPQAEEPVPVPQPRPLLASNGQLMVPETEEPAYAGRTVVASNPELLPWLKEEVEPESSAPLDVDPLGGEAETVVAEADSAPVTSDADTQPGFFGRIFGGQGRQVEAPEPVEKPVAENPPIILAENPDPVPVIEEGVQVEPVAIAEVAEPTTDDIEPVTIEVAEPVVEERQPGFFARIFGGQGRRSEPVAPTAPAIDPEPERVVIAQISSNDPDLALVADDVTVEALDQSQTVVATASATPVVPATVASTPASTTDIQTDAAGRPISQDTALALIEARERREAREAAAALAEAETVVAEVAPDPQPVQIIGQPAVEPSQIAALPPNDAVPSEPLVSPTDQTETAIVSGPIDPTIQIFQRHFSQSGTSVELPTQVAAIPRGSLTTDMPPSLPRLGVIYFKPGEIEVSRNQWTITQAAAADLYRAGQGSLRLVARRNTVGMPGDPDPNDAPRRRLQEVIAGLTASGVPSRAIVTEIATANSFYADMDYNRRVEIYLDSATAAR